jgi:hypothetical protein
MVYARDCSHLHASTTEKHLIGHVHLSPVYGAFDDRDPHLGFEQVYDCTARYPFQDIVRHRGRDGHAVSHNE